MADRTGLSSTGGVVPSQETLFFFWNQHGVDTNGDGQFDLRIYEAIDMDGDGRVEEGATAWLYDIDHDGLIDKAEHIVKGRIMPIKPDNDAFRLRYMLRPEPSEQPRIGQQVPTELFKMIADDINALPGT